METMTHSAMQELKSSSTVQDSGSPPTEKSVCMDGASRLLRLGQTGSGTWG